MAEGSSDQHSASRAVLRENVKWLATCFSGAIAIVLAGTPFVGLGKLEVGSQPFVLALVGLVAGTALLLVAIGILLFILRPDAIYADYLRDGFVPPTTLGRVERREIAAVKKEFEARKLVLLPDGADKLDDLELHVEERWAIFKSTKSEDDRKLWALPDEPCRDTCLGFVHAPSSASAAWHMGHWAPWGDLAAVPRHLCVGSQQHQGARRAAQGRRDLRRSLPCASAAGGVRAGSL